VRLWLSILAYIGYMLRVRHRETGKDKFYYFMPAASFPVAGNELTRELRNHYRAMNQPITQVEAEARKLQQTGWHTLAFVDTWRTRIAQHVGEYVGGLPDYRWLPLPHVCQANPCHMSNWRH
jgi:hypothetical protein